MRERSLVEGVFTRNVLQNDKAKPELAGHGIPESYYNKQGRKEDIICQPQTRSPQEEQKKEDGVPRCF